MDNVTHIDLLTAQFGKVVDHAHAPSFEGDRACHHRACKCVRCLLEAGPDVPRDVQVKADTYRMRIEVAMYVCPNCRAVQVALIPAVKGAPPSWVCLTCGGQGLRPEQAVVDTTPQTLATRVNGSSKRPLTLAERMGKAPAKQEQPDEWQVGRHDTTQVAVANRSLSAKLKSPIQTEGTHKAGPSTPTPGKAKPRAWGAEELRNLKRLINEHGAKEGIERYLTTYPSEGRTVQGCQYQHETKIKKGLVD